MFAYLDDDNDEPEVGDKISFLTGCPELCHKLKALMMLRFNCLCLQHIVLDLSVSKFESPNVVDDGPDLSEIIRPIQSCLLCSNPEKTILTDASSITECLETQESFGGIAVKPGYNPWSYVDFSIQNQILKEVVITYKEILAASTIKEESLDISPPDAMYIQSPVPTEPRKIRWSK